MTCVILLAAITFVIGVTFKKRLVKYYAGILVAGALIGYFVESQEMRDILVAFAIVAVAFLSALSINEAKRLRKEHGT